jgi:hypothetical protein
MNLRNKNLNFFNSVPSSLGWKLHYVITQGRPTASTRAFGLCSQWGQLQSLKYVLTAPRRGSCIFRNRLILFSEGLLSPRSIL